MRANCDNFVFTVACKFLKMRIPTLQVVLLPCLLDDSEGQQLRVVLGERAPPEELLGPDHDVVFEELKQGVIEGILLEYDSTGEVEVQKGNEGGVLHLEVHGLEYAPLCLLVLLLAESLLRVPLVTIEIRHILIKLNGLPCHNQGSTTPKFLTGIHFLKNLVDV